MSPFSINVQRVENGYIVALHAINEQGLTQQEINVFGNRFDALEYIDNVLTTADTDYEDEDVMEYIVDTDAEILEGEQL